MTKKDFEEFLKSNLKYLPLEEQEKILYRMKDTWMPDITKKLKDRLKQSYYLCSKCGRYSLKKKCSVEKKTKICKDVLIYPYYGSYGNGDTLVDEVYLLEYSVCPLCGGLTQIKKDFMYAENYRSRWD